MRSGAAPGRQSEGGRLGEGRRKEEKRKGGEALRAAGVLSSSRCHTASDTNDPPDRLTHSPPPHHHTHSTLLVLPFWLFTPSPFSFSDTGFDVDDATSVLSFFC